MEGRGGMNGRDSLPPVAAAAAASCAARAARAAVGGGGGARDGADPDSRDTWCGCEADGGGGCDWLLGDGSGGGGGCPLMALCDGDAGGGGGGGPRPDMAQSGGGERSDGDAGGGADDGRRQREDSALQCRNQSVQAARISHYSLFSRAIPSSADILTIMQLHTEQVDPAGCMAVGWLAVALSLPSPVESAAAVRLPCHCSTVCARTICRVCSCSSSSPPLPFFPFFLPSSVCHSNTATGCWLLSLRPLIRPNPAHAGPTQPDQQNETRRDETTPFVQPATSTHRLRLQNKVRDGTTRSKQIDWIDHCTVALAVTSSH